MHYERASATSVLRIAGWFAALFLAAGSCTGLAAAELKSGEGIYKETCFACHATGVAGAPKYGDKKIWAPLIKEGQHVLTSHAWVGVRGMPAQGGRTDLSLEEFSRAVAYMARAAGGDWKDPDAKMLNHIGEEAKERIKKMKAKK